MVPATSQWINRESGDMNARIAYTRRVRWRGNGYYGQLHPHQKVRTSERPWKQLGGRSHYCASLTPASDLPRRGRADLSGSSPRLCRGTNASTRACVREEKTAPRGHLASAPFPIAYPGVCTMRLFSENEENVTWETDLRRVLRRVCDTFCETQSVRRGRGSSCKVTVAMRRFLSTAAVCCWLLVALGVGQVSTRNCSLRDSPLGYPPNRFKRASERAGSRACLHADVSSNRSAGNFAGTGIRK